MEKTVSFAPEINEFAPEINDSPKMAYLIIDSKTNAIVAVCDSFQKQNEIHQKLINDDIEIEKINLRIKIMNEEDKSKSQELEMTLINLEQQQKHIKNKRGYFIGDKTKDRYLIFTKTMNDDLSKIFIYSS